MSATMIISVARRRQTLRFLQILANNLWWATDPETKSLFSELAPDRWKQLNHNPVALLAEIHGDELDVALDQVSVGSDGSVYYQDPNQNEPVLAGQLELAYFQNNAGLETIGQNLYLETYASGPVQTGDPGTDGLGRITSGYLEGSNVDPVTQLVDLIRTQRTFEMNSQALQAADETLRTVVNIAN